MGLTLVTAATGFPVSAAEAKAHCRVDDSASDALFTTLIGAATAAIEEICSRSLMTQTWRLVLNEFCSEIELSRGPVSAVGSVKYLDNAGAEQTVASDVYSLDLVSDPQMVVLNTGFNWPVPGDYVNPVRINFTAGYTILPAPLKLAVLELVTSWFDNRTSGDVPPGVLSRLEPYRAEWVAA